MRHPGLELGGRGRLGWNWNQRDAGGGGEGWMCLHHGRSRSSVMDWLTEPWRGVELAASAEVEIGGYHDLHNCIDCIGSGFLGPCKPLPISTSY